MLAIVTAVNVVVTGDDPTRADMLDGYRAALVVPLVAVLGRGRADGDRACAAGPAATRWLRPRPPGDTTTLQPAIPPTGVEAA